MVAIIFEELWWEEDENGNWYCPQTNDDDRISDKDWKEAWDDMFIIPKWEVEQQEKYVGGIGNRLSKLSYNPDELLCNAKDEPWYAPVGIPRGNIC